MSHGMVNGRVCDRCNGRKWIPVEGTISCAIVSASDPSKRVPCPECMAEVPAADGGLVEPSTTKALQTSTEAPQTAVEPSSVEPSTKAPVEFPEFYRSWLERLAKDNLETIPLHFLIDVQYAAVESKGFHIKDDGTVIASSYPPHPLAQLASLAPVVKALGTLTDVIRNPYMPNDARHQMLAEVGERLSEEAVKFTAPYGGPAAAGVTYPLVDLDEKPTDKLYMSKTLLASNLILMVSEIAEALEALERGDWQNYVEEVGADLLLRLTDHLGTLKIHPATAAIDVQQMIAKKILYNLSRPYKHGKNS